MKRLHLPRIDARYWYAILLASILGTNLGDLYAHDSGLGMWRGVFVLCVLATIVFVIERFDAMAHQAYYWLAIVIIRTGATNIADYFKHIIDHWVFLGGLAAVLVMVTLLSRHARDQADPADETRLPKAGAIYWLGMLDAGVFGTLGGDMMSHAIGQGPASLVLGALMLIALAARHRYAAATIGAYWGTVAIARSAGTSMGDFVAESHALNIGLPLATLITGSTFAAVVFLGRGERTADAAAVPTRR